GQGPQVLCSIKFRTSEYNTFENKLNSFTDISLDGLVDTDAPMIGGTEPFDVYEVEGNGQLPPLISWQGQLSSWLQNDVIPDLYTNFPKVGTHMAVTVNIQFDRDISIH